MTIPNYPKVVAFGTNGTDEVLNGTVRIDEKVDGSQFGFGLEAPGGDVLFRSHGAQIYIESCPSTFKLVVDHVLAHQGWLRSFSADSYPIYFYGEAITKPKHNVLTYMTVPQGSVVLFDALVGGKWVNTRCLEYSACGMDITFIPPLFEGEITKDSLMTLFEGIGDRVSALGGTAPEGLVVKNYSKYMNIGGNVWPIMVKLVRQQYKEKHAREWASQTGKAPIQSLVESFKGDEARWNKAIMHLREQGVLENSPRDIGKLIAYVQQDMMDEEKEAIKGKLWQLYSRDFQRASVAGLAEFYKNQLAQEA